MAITGALNDLRDLGAILDESEDFITLDLDRLFRVNYFLYVDDSFNICFGLISNIYTMSNIKFYMSNKIPKESLLSYDCVKFITNTRSDK